MTKRERRDAHAWRKCSYCGRFVSYADLDAKCATHKLSMVWDYYREEPVEESDTYHIACAEKYAAQQQEAK
jgi:hypothetical protein